MSESNTLPHHRGPSGSGEPRLGETRANGLRLVYHAWAGPARTAYPPAVLLHGVLQSKEGMANLAAHLARGGPVVVPDLRGRGESDQPPDGYDPATMADDVAALVEAEGLDRPVVIGRLHGGLVACHLAARRPDLVRGLVIGDTPPEVDEPRAARALERVRALPPRFPAYDDALAYYQDRLGLSEARARHDIPHDLVPEPDGGLRWRHNLAIVERIEAAAMPRSAWDVLAAVHCPTLLLRGQRGEIPPEMARRVGEIVARCQVQTVLGARHDVFLGPGCEQAFGAIHLFLRRLADADDTGPLPPPAAAPTANADALAAIDRIVRAINSRDADAVEAAFAPDGRIVQYRPEGKVREGGLEAARAAFEDVVADLPGGVVEARDVVVAGERAACVLVVRDAVEPAGGAPDPGRVLLAPVFLTVRDGRIAELASYGLRVPADRT